MTLLACLIVAWLAFVIRIGGDFIEYRMLVPVLPCAFVLLTWACTEVVRWRVVGAALVSLTIAGSISHARSFELTYGIESARLSTVDMLGLADPWVARHGIRSDLMKVSPGHNRLATFDYLVQRDVNLVVGMPLVRETEPRSQIRFGSGVLARFSVPIPRREDIPARARMEVLQIRLEAGRSLFVLYLMPNEHVDKVIADRGILVHRISLDGFRG